MVELQTGGPSAMAKYASDPEFAQLLQKIQAAMAGGAAAGGTSAPDGGMGFTAGKAPSQTPPTWKTTNPNAGSFGFESVLNEPSPAAGADKRQSSGGSSADSGGAGPAGGGGLEQQLKARIQEVEKKTEGMLDQQQRDALERWAGAGPGRDGAGRGLGCVWGGGRKPYIPNRLPKC